MSVKASRREIAQQIELAVLNPATVRSRLDEACRLGRQQGVAVVCVRPCDLRRCAEMLDGSRTAAGTTIGFPHGGSTRTVKVHEAREAIEDAQSVLGSNAAPVELDLVVNAGSVLSGDWGAVRDEIQAVLDVTHARGGKLKVVVEPAWFNAEQIKRLCEKCGDLGADFMAASTGFGPRTATVEDVRLLRRYLPETVRIKATGEAESLDDFQALIDAGADRIGTPHAIELLDSYDG
ncbi:MAG: deoxyribose-phosphate aldolase [Planctomycetaceae bacterium]